MGPTLARMAVRALDQLNSPYHVYGAARFSQPGTREQLEAWGVRTVTCDLLDRSQLADLPDSGSVIYMAGQKFGTTGNQHMTWGINTYLPALACERYVDARIVAFSTGNVYPLAPVVAGGPLEDDPLEPVGEYAMSCLGRERIFDYFSRRHGLRCAIVRLNYAVEMRYGVLVDIARSVYAEQPVSLDMGAANVIWQGDANAQAIALLDHCATPPFVLNVTGPETVSVRRVAQILGGMLGKAPRFEGEEAATALLNNAAKSAQLLGYPRVSLHQMLEWIADWVQNDGPSLDKPTHFETRDGSF
jgi:nucleoside-diphosphate-sugar epimerase